MNISDAYKRVLKSKNNKGDLSIERPLMYLFDVDVESSSRWHQDEREDRFVGYWLRRVMDTDTHVGTVVYFLDNKAVMIAHQTGRKCDAKIQFIDEAAFQEMREFITLFREFDAPDPILLSASSFDIDEFVVFENANYVVERKAIYMGKLVEVAHVPYNLPQTNSDIYVVIDGEKKLINVNELSFPLNLSD